MEEKRKNEMKKNVLKMLEFYENISKKWEK